MDINDSFRQDVARLKREVDAKQQAIKETRDRAFFAGMEDMYDQPVHYALFTRSLLDADVGEAISMAVEKINGHWIVMEDE